MLKFVASRISNKYVLSAKIDKIIYKIAGIKQLNGYQIEMANSLIGEPVYHIPGKPTVVSWRQQEDNNNGVWIKLSDGQEIWHHLAYRPKPIKKATEKSVAAHPFITSLITPEIKKQFDIDEAEEPFKSGNRSAVFENKRGNIVAFINAANWAHGERACQQAYKSVGRDSEVIPEVYNIEYLETTGKISSEEYAPVKLCVIEMQKFEPLTDIQSELHEILKHFHNVEYIIDIIRFAKSGDDIKTIIEKMTNKHQSSFTPKAINFYINIGTKPLFEKVNDLYQRMKDEGIEHRDLHVGNVVLDSEGRLRLIDWESIILPD